MSMPVYPSLGHQQVTSLSSSASLTVPAGAVYCTLQAETQNVRYRGDGTAPTTAVGTLLYAGANAIDYVGDLTKLRFIEVLATAKLNVEYFGDETNRQGRLTANGV